MGLPQWPKAMQVNSTGARVKKQSRVQTCPKIVASIDFLPGLVKSRKQKVQGTCQSRLLAHLALPVGEVSFVLGAPRRAVCLLVSIEAKVRRVPSEQTPPTPPRTRSHAHSQLRRRRGQGRYRCRRAAPFTLRSQAFACAGK